MNRIVNDTLFIADHQDIKANIRLQILAKRKALSAEYRAKTAQKFAHFVENSSLFDTTNTIATYWPIRSELDVMPAMAILRRMGKKLALPAIIAENIMVFRQYDNDDALQDMSFGTKGPNAECQIIDPAIIFLPLSAFDESGNRIGYGGGYYDRAIAALHQKGVKPILMGLAFNCQQVEKIVQESHDIPLDMVWTESGLLIC